MSLHRKPESLWKIAAKVAVFIAALIILVKAYDYVQAIGYGIFFEENVKETIRALVKPEALK